MKKLALFLLLLLVIAAGAAGAWVYLRVGEPYRGYEGAEQFVEMPSGAGQPRDRRPPGAAGIVRDALSFRAGLYRLGAGAPSAGRRVPVRSRDDAAARSSTRWRAATCTSSTSRSPKG